MGFDRFFIFVAKDCCKIYDQKVISKLAGDFC